MDIEWFKTWKHYTRYSKIKIHPEFMETPNGIDDQSMTTLEDDNMMSDDLANLNIHKEIHNALQ